VEGDPAVTGRWGASVVLLPSGPLASELDRWTTLVGAQMGPDHWATGSLGAAHVTLRALQHRDVPATARQVDALRRAVEGPVTLSFEGLRVTDAAVLALASSPDGSGDRLRQGYASELGPVEGWLEDAHLGPGGRDLWYATLVHVAASVLEWPASSSLDGPVGSEVFGEAHVCEWRFDPVARRMVPEVIDTVPLR
jgi:hypothetical protein